MYHYVIRIRDNQEVYRSISLDDCARYKRILERENPTEYYELM